MVSAGKPYVIKPHVVQVIHGVLHLALQTYKQKLNEVKKGRAAGLRHDYGPQLLCVLPCTRIRSEMLYIAKGLAEKRKIFTATCLHLWKAMEAISARLKDSTLG